MKVVEADERQREIEGTSQNKMIETEAQDAAATDYEIELSSSPLMIYQQQENIKKKNRQNAILKLRP